MPRTGVLDVNLRGECIGRCASVRCIGVFVARVEGARMNPALFVAGAKLVVRGVEVGGVHVVHVVILTNLNCYAIEIAFNHNHHAVHVIHLVRGRLQEAHNCLTYAVASPDSG